MGKTHETRAEAARAEEDDPEFGPCSSPPCLMHEVDPVYLGLSDSRRTPLDPEAAVAEAASEFGAKP